jgi:integrase
MAKSTRLRAVKKPYAEFPLTAHMGAGQWSKKFKPPGAERTKTFYFGPLADWEAAKARYTYEWPFIIKGKRIPLQPGEGALTVGGLCNIFDAEKKQAMANGELRPTTYRDYHRACQHVVNHFGRERPVATLTTDDFADLRNALAKGRGLVTLANYIRNIRILFRHAYDPDEQNNLIDSPVRMGKAFREPKRENVRKEKQERELVHGKRRFDAVELRTMLKALDGIPVEVERNDETVTVTLRRDPVLRAMLLLAVNCGYGQTDIANLHQRHLDLVNGWATYPRPKTAIDRRCALWPETIMAIRDALAVRRAPKSDADAGQVFLSRYRRRWVSVTSKGGVTDTVGATFGRVLKALGLKRKGLNWYALRHVTETEGGNARDQEALNMVMGHLDASMAARYRDGIIDDRLIAVSNCLRAWLFDSGGPPDTKPAVDRRSLLRIVGGVS